MIARSLRRGFTLVELMLALGLAISLLAAMTSFTWNLLDRRTTLARGARDVQAATAFIERLESDLLAGLAGDSGVGAGVLGTATSLRLLTRGVWLANDAPSIGGDDLQGTEYTFDGVGRLSARRWVQPLSATAGAAGAPPTDLISDRVERVRFRYFDGRSWRESFDSRTEGGLPVAIEAAVWFTALRNEVATAPPSPDRAESAGADGSSTTDGSDDLAELEPDFGPPDRLRVIVVPDGPLTAWRSSP